MKASSAAYIPQRTPEALGIAGAEVGLAAPRVSADWVDSQGAALQVVGAGQRRAPQSETMTERPSLVMCSGQKSENRWGQREAKGSGRR